MDMVGNRALQFSLHYDGGYDCGRLEASFYNQYVRHSMQFGDDKQFLYRGNDYLGMPMETEVHTYGGTLIGKITLDVDRTVKLGAEWQLHCLND